MLIVVIVIVILVVAVAVVTIAAAVAVVAIVIGVIIVMICDSCSGLNKRYCGRVTGFAAIVRSCRVDCPPTVCVLRVESMVKVASGNMLNLRLILSTTSG